MSSKIWLGRIYLREEGGYELVLRALDHYKKRLRDIGSSPQLRDAPMFAQLVQHEAIKNVSVVDGIVEKIQRGLGEPEFLGKLENEISFIEKALACYQADIQKALHGDAFYVKALQGSNFADTDLKSIKDALQKIRQFC
ncbi:MAG: hypothetical protein QW177_09260 [Candidatus Nitrosotenuis sp.]